MRNFDIPSEASEPSPTHIAEPPQSFQSADNTTHWASAENVSSAYDSSAMTAASTSALEHTKPTEITDEDEAGTDEAGHRDQGAAIAPLPAPGKEHRLLNTEEFRSYTRDLLPDEPLKYAAGTVMNGIVGAAISEHPQLAALPASEQPAYYVETRDHPEGEWVISVPNLKQHLDALRGVGRLAGKRSSKVLDRIEALPDGMPRHYETSETALEPTPTDGADDGATDETTEEPSMWPSEFKDPANDPTIAVLQEEYGEGDIITSSDFKKLAAEVDPGANKITISRAFSVLVEHASSFNRTTRGLVPSVHRIKTTTGGMDWALSTSGTLRNMPLIQGHSRGLNGRTLGIINNILKLAQERAEAAQNQPEVEQ